jgi:hypothetical protein
MQHSLLMVRSCRAIQICACPRPHLPHKMCKHNHAIQTTFSPATFTTCRMHRVSSCLSVASTRACTVYRCVCVCVCVCVTNGVVMKGLRHETGWPRKGLVTKRSGHERVSPGKSKVTKRPGHKTVWSQKGLRHERARGHLTFAGRIHGEISSQDSSRRPHACKRVHEGTTPGSTSRKPIRIHVLHTDSGNNLVI